MYDFNKEVRFIFLTIKSYISQSIKFDEQLHEHDLIQ